MARQHVWPVPMGVLLSGSNGVLPTDANGDILRGDGEVVMGRGHGEGGHVNVEFPPKVARTCNNTFITYHTHQYVNVSMAWETGESKCQPCGRST